jgi:hypothetical protein
MFVLLRVGLIKTRQLLDSFAVSRMLIVVSRNPTLNQVFRLQSVSFQEKQVAKRLEVYGKMVMIGCGWVGE